MCVPLRSNGHFLHCDTSLTDMVSPTCVIVSRPALYVLMRLTLTMRVPRGPLAREVTVPVSTAKRTTQSEHATRGTWKRNMENRPKMDLNSFRFISCIHLGKKIWTVIGQSLCPLHSNGPIRFPTPSLARSVQFEVSCQCKRQHYLQSLRYSTKFLANSIRS